MSQLLKDQMLFARLVAELIQFAGTEGYELTLGDAFATSGHCARSFHYRRLAIDLNLFRDGRYLTCTADHLPLGEYWKSLNPKCTWGGDFARRDGNHYSFGEK